eukprot:3129279-Prymnesium_polylepis.1
MRLDGTFRELACWMSGIPEFLASGTAGVWSFVLSVSYRVTHALVVDPSHLTTLKPSGTRAADPYARTAASTQSPVDT